MQMFVILQIIVIKFEKTSNSCHGVIKILTAPLPFDTDKLLFFQCAGCNQLQQT